MKVQALFLSIIAVASALRTTCPKKPVRACTVNDARLQCACTANVCSLYLLINDVLLTQRSGSWRSNCWKMHQRGKQCREINFSSPFRDVLLTTLIRSVRPWEPSVVEPASKWNVASQHGWNLVGSWGMVEP